MRRLLIIPIIHSQSDLGSLAEVASASKSAALGMGRAAISKRSIEQFWQELTEQLQSLHFDYGNLLIYQDGLPAIENTALQLERQIVEDLARNGSPNHRLVKWLMDQGACLVGTESPQLLMQEYAAIRKSLARGFRDAEDRAADDPAIQTTANIAQSSATSGGADAQETSECSLLEQRDRFIADRISQTLGNEQWGVLFIGMLHKVERFLTADIVVQYPMGRPQGQTTTMIDS